MKTIVKFLLVFVVVGVAIDEKTVVEEETQNILDGIKEDFQAFDADKDGRLSKSELTQLFDHKWKKDITVEDKEEAELTQDTYIESMYTHFADFDKDKNGISMQQFQDAIHPEEDLNQINEEAL